MKSTVTTHPVAPLNAVQHACPARDDWPRGVAGEDDQRENVHGQSPVVRVKGVCNRAANHGDPDAAGAALLRGQWRCCGVLCRITYEEPRNDQACEAARPNLRDEHQSSTVC